MLEKQGIVENMYIRDFILAGRCECAIENIKSSNRFLYKVRQNKDNSSMFFITSITGMGDIYCGFIIIKDDGVIMYNKGAKGQVDESDTRIQALLYILNHSKNLPPYIIVQHFGKCSRCGRKLTDLDSIRRGLGPECAKKV